ncbi:hypothetical protein [Deinococcus misasensis]|uniref:hypothetical protein n=1 Tax=Deinococcus misasensis TaxID=392413 RepID=UPI00055043E5|nr:hypothetical protein [Deinococcus misasensis]
MKPRKVMGVALLVATLGGLAYFARSYKPSIIKTDKQMIQDRLDKVNRGEIKRSDFANSIISQLIGGKT